MGKKIWINGTDFTSYFTPWGYTCAYRKIQGGNQGTMMDGSFQDDVLAYKITFSLVCLPLSETKYQNLIAALYGQNQAYVKVQFYDPRTKGYRTSDCTFSVTDQTERGAGADGTVLWTGMRVTFEER